MSEKQWCVQRRVITHRKASCPVQTEEEPGGRGGGVVCGVWCGRSSVFLFTLPTESGSRQQVLPSSFSFPLQCRCPQRGELPRRVGGGGKPESTNQSQ